MSASAVATNNNGSAALATTGQGQSQGNWKLNTFFLTKKNWADFRLLIKKHDFN